MYSGMKMEKSDLLKLFLQCGKEGLRKMIEEVNSTMQKLL
jgi:hypothetical protein